MATADLQHIRIELKEWEHEFLAANGRKPGRADIKGNRDMAAKYKLYDKLTRKASGKDDNSKPSSPTGSKRKRDSGIGLVEETATTTTPRKTLRTRNGGVTSGLKPGSLEQTSSDPYDPPLSNLFSPSVPKRTVIGPTPQRNGRVLGLFDLLSPESARKSTTPSKSRNPALLSSQTPSKRSGDPAAGTPSRSRMSPPAGTPSKRNGTQKGILTPSRSRLNAREEGQQQGVGVKNTTTPSIQRSKILDLDATPDFLKRRRSPAFRPSSSANGLEAGAIGDDADGLMNISWSPIAVRQPRRPIGRSFSEIVNANRKAEEERYDDDLNILRELEQEGKEGGGAQKRPVQRSKSAIEPLGTDIAQKPPVDSSGDLPLGPDGERDIDKSDEEAEEGSTTKPAGRRWKKKGPKRQTRRVNIRPTQAKWQPEPEWKAGIESDQETESQDRQQEGSDVVLETQIAGSNLPAEGDDDELDSEFEYVSDSGAKTSVKAKKTLKNAGGNRAQKGPTEAARKETKGRKISATAHANYRTLRIKNKNSKAKRGGRFGRRR